MAAAGSLGLGVPSVASAATATPEPSVIFTALGMPPLSCGSRPDVSSLMVPEGTSIVVENAIGESAWVRVGEEPVIEVADGQGAALVLTVGQHDVRMVPACLVVGSGAAVPVAVSVMAGASPPTSASPEPPAPSTSTSSPVAIPVTVPGATTAATDTAPAVGPTLSVVPGSPNGLPDVVPAGTAVVVGTGDPTPTATGAALGRSAVIAVTPVDFGGGHDPKGVRLLAIIATICVLGVTAAIIRSIVRLSP